MLCVLGRAGYIAGHEAVDRGQFGGGLNARQNKSVLGSVPATVLCAGTERKPTPGMRITPHLRRFSVTWRGVCEGLDHEGLGDLGDFNGDGRDDVLLRHTDDRWFYYPMDGRPTSTVYSAN